MNQELSMKVFFFFFGSQEKCILEVFICLDALRKAFVGF